MNRFQKITNEKWQIALDRIKNNKKDREDEESIVEIRENIRNILRDNLNGELKDQKQLDYLQKHLNQIGFFQQLWEYKEEQFHIKRIEAYNRENGIYEQKKQPKKKRSPSKKRSKSPTKSPSADQGDSKINNDTKGEIQKKENEKSFQMQEIERQVEREVLEAQRKLFSNLRLRRYDRNSYVYKEGDKNCQDFYILWYGEAEEIIASETLSHEQSEKLKIPRKKRLKEGEYFGEKELVIRGQRQASVRCLEETFMLSINQQIFYSLVSGFIKFRNPILSSQEDGSQKSLISTFLDREDILQLSYISQTQTLIYGNTIYSENDVADSFYALSQGQVTFSKIVVSQVDHLENSRVTPPKRRKQISFVTAIEYFGEENLQIQYQSIQPLDQDGEEQDEEEIKEQLMLKIQSKREYTASVASDKAVIHRIPYSIFIDKMYLQYSHLKSHDMLNRYIETRTSWRSENQQKIDNIIQSKNYNKYIEGKSTNLLACKTGEPLEKYSLDRLREPVSSSKPKHEEAKRSVTAGLRSRGGARTLRKMSTVNSIVLTEDNNQQDTQTTQILQQTNLVSNHSFSKFQDIPIHYNNNTSGLGSLALQKTTSNSPEKRIVQNQSFMNLMRLTEVESDQQQQFTPGKVINLNHRSSRLGNQASSQYYSTKYNKNASKTKEAEINFLEFVQFREQQDMKKTLGQQFVTPKSQYGQQQFQFDMKDSFIQNTKYSPPPKFTLEKETSKFQNKSQDRNIQIKLSNEGQVKKISTNDLKIQVNGDERGVLKQNIQYLNVYKSTPQNNSKSTTNGVTTQASRDVSPDIRKKQDQRRFTSTSTSSVNHPLIKIIQDSSDRRQSQMTDQRSKSNSNVVKQQMNNLSSTPRVYSLNKTNDLGQQRLVTDLDEFYKQNSYLESLIEERQSNLGNDSTFIYDERLHSATPEFSEKISNTSLIKRKQYSAMLQSQQGQHKIPISISNQKSILFDLDDKKASSNILHFKQKAIKQVTHSNLPVKLDVSGICQQTHRYDHLIRKLEMKKKNLKEMQQQEYGDKRRIPTSAMQYKKSQNIILSMVDNYFKNISSNSGYPTGGPSLKQFIQNTPNSGATTTTINGFSTQYTKNGSTKPTSELSKNSFINYFRSPLKTAQSFRSRSNPKQQQQSSTLQQNNANAARYLSVTNPMTRDNQHTELNQTFSTFMLTNTQMSPI